MSDSSAILSLPYIQPSQAQKHVTHNEALATLDVLVQLAVASRSETTPPATPGTGERHIVAAGATGDWAGHDGKVAVWDETSWRMLPPQAGWRAWVADEETTVLHDGTGWILPPPDLGGVTLLGVNATADSGNRLAVASPATLLTNEGAGHQLKINKATAGDTASLLFQTGWSGRAEMGTQGSDAFAVKVSADGSTWSTALSIPGGTGKPDLPQGITLTGMATGTGVQQSATDTTAGRLMRADYGYGRGNLLGTVGESGGVPTGAVIERGSNANGTYVRFADGTQICWNDNFSLPYQSYDKCRADWTYPAAFAAAPGTFAMLNVSASTVAPPTSDLQAVNWSNSGANTTTARLSVFRVTGGTSFGTSDIISLRVTAVGKWF